MAVYQTGRHRGLAVLVRSYRSVYVLHQRCFRNTRRSFIKINAHAIEVWFSRHRLYPN